MCCTPEGGKPGRGCSRAIMIDLYPRAVALTRSGLVDGRLLFYLPSIPSPPLNVFVITRTRFPALTRQCKSTAVPVLAGLDSCTRKTCIVIMCLL